MSRAVPPILAAAAGLALLAGAQAAQAQPGPPAPAAQPVADPACASLAAPGLFKDATVSSASGMSSAAGTYCEMKATLSPVAGSKISARVWSWPRTSRIEVSQTSYSFVK